MGYQLTISVKMNPYLTQKEVQSLVEDVKESIVTCCSENLLVENGITVKVESLGASWVKVWYLTLKSALRGN